MFQIKEYLKRLTAAYGVSGYESGAAEELKNILSGYCEDVSVDKMGNVIARLGCGLKNAKNVMLEAHMDQIGFIISKIEDDGKIRVKPIGGFDSGILPGLCVKIFGSKRGAEDSDLSGASGAVLDGAIMINASFKQADKAPGFDDIYIETGYSKEELDKRLCIGDPAAFAGEAKELLGDNMSSKAMDNRAGAVAILNTLDMLYSEIARARHVVRKQRKTKARSDGRFFDAGGDRLKGRDDRRVRSGAGFCDSGGRDPRRDAGFKGRDRNV